MKVEAQSRKALFTIELDEDDMAAVACAAIRGLETYPVPPMGKTGSGRSLDHDRVKRFHCAVYEAFNSIGRKLPDSVDIIGPRGVPGHVCPCGDCDARRTGQ